MEQSPVDMSLDDSPFLDMSLTDPSFFEMSSDGRASWEAVSQTNTSTTEPNEPMELYPSLSCAPVGAFYKGRFLAQSHWINYAQGVSAPYSFKQNWVLERISSHLSHIGLGSPHCNTIS